MSKEDCNHLWVGWDVIEACELCHITRRIEPEPEVNFDIERMTEALSGDRTTMPENLTSEEFLEWMAKRAQELKK